MAGDQHDEVEEQGLPMGFDQSRNIGSDAQVLVGHPAQIDDVDEHQHALPWCIDERVVEAVVDPAMRQFQCLVTNDQGVSVVEYNMRRWSPRIAPSGQQVGRTPIRDDRDVASSTVQVRRLTMAVDCGKVLDPGIATSNILGGSVWGLSGMQTAVTFERGSAQQNNFERVRAPAPVADASHRSSLCPARKSRAALASSARCRSTPRCATPSCRDAPATFGRCRCPMPACHLREVCRGHSENQWT
jgi:Molybdopterin-binding domain of aldehyde dehydrogenase